MRKFKCDECGHEFDVPFGEKGQGRDLKCPECGGKPHRVDTGGKGRGAGKGQGACHGGRNHD